MKYLENRELAIASSKEARNPLKNHIFKRNIRINTKDQLQFQLDYNKVADEHLNLFTSVAKFRTGVPMRYWTDMAKDEKVQADWKKNYFRSMVGYDFFIDIDCKRESEFPAVLESARELKKRFDKEKRSYEIRFSGRGFHFIIPYDRFNLDLSFDVDHDYSIYRWFADLGEMYYGEVSEFIDLSIYEPRRLIKIPYTIAWYDEGAYVCLPVTNLDNFHRNYYKLENIFTRLCLKQSR